jgi:hypothetical protein
MISANDPKDTSIGLGNVTTDFTAGDKLSGIINLTNIGGVGIWCNFKYSYQWIIYRYSTKY